VHELSIVLNILEIAGKARSDQGLGRIEKIRIRVGRASGAMTEALQFSYEAAREGTAAAGAVLEIEEVPVGGSCRSCGGDFTVDEKYVLQCPLCGGPDFVVTQGNELDITDMEVED